MQNKTLLQALLIVLCEFLLPLLLFYLLLPQGSMLALPPVLIPVYLLVFPGLPVFHLIYFLRNRNSSDSKKRALAKYTFIGNALAWLLIVLAVVLFAL